MLLLLALLVFKLKILNTASLHDADVFYVVNAHFIWVYH
jgi:hypothetical protein